MDIADETAHDLVTTAPGVEPHDVVVLLYGARYRITNAALTGGQDSLERVAERTGTGSGELVRGLSERELGITPGAHRRRFATTAAANR